jgi:hypothetical protein
MKFKHKAFPYPVLTSANSGRDDYVSSSYEYDFSVEPEDISEVESKKRSLKVIHRCTCEEVLQLVSEKKACYVTLVKCKKTISNRIFKTFNDEQIIPIDLGDYFGRLEISTQIIATSNIDIFSSHDLNLEFSGCTFSFSPGDRLAIGDEIQLSCDFNKISFESLITIDLSDDLEDDEYLIKVKAYSIQVLMGKRIRTLFAQLESDKKTEPYLFMSILKDIYLHVLQAISSDEELKDSIVERTIIKQMNKFDIQISDEPNLDELNGYAQRFVSKRGVEALSARFEL